VLVTAEVLLTASAVECAFIVTDDPVLIFMTPEMLLSLKGEKRETRKLIMPLLS
jgi:hypothetical protein